MSYSPRFRVVSHEDNRLLKEINKVFYEVNVKCKDDRFMIKPLDVHLLDRARDREVDLDDMLLVLAYVAKRRMSEIIEEIGFNKVTNPVAEGELFFVKFSILYGEEFIIHATCKEYDDDFLPDNVTNHVIRIHTVMPYRKNYNYEAFMIKVNKLVRRPVEV